MTVPFVLAAIVTLVVVFWWLFLAAAAVVATVLVLRVAATVLVVRASMRCSSGRPVLAQRPLVPDELLVEVHDGASCEVCGIHSGPTSWFHPSVGHPTATRPGSTSLRSGPCALTQTRQATSGRFTCPVDLSSYPWDAGTARLLADLGFQALATTSSGHAATLGRSDGSVTRDEALAHAAALVAAVDVPVSADLEDGFGQGADVVGATVTGAAEVGLAGCSIEDFSGGADGSIYDMGLAAERVAAAVEAAHGGVRLVLTARAENFVRGQPDLADTISRLQAYQEAGADVLYAPGLADIDDVRRLVGAVDRPVNVLLRPGLPPVAALAQAGVARISVGGAFSQVALAALTRAGRELLDRGTYGFMDLAAEGRQQAARVFG